MSGRPTHLNGQTSSRVPLSTTPKRLFDRPAKSLREERVQKGIDAAVEKEKKKCDRLNNRCHTMDAARS